MSFKPICSIQEIFDILWDAAVQLEKIMNWILSEAWALYRERRTEIINEINGKVFHDYMVLLDVYNLFLKGGWVGLLLKFLR